jgi:hypothetical protein
VKTFFTIAGIIFRNTQESDKQFYGEVEEKGIYILKFNILNKNLSICKLQF